MTTVQFPSDFEHIFTEAARFRVWYGGRGSAKSWSVARALLLKAVSEPIRVLCTRQFQVSIAESSHRLLSDQIYEMGLTSYFEITKSEIRSINGSIFIFRGMQNAAEIKSMEGINIAWIEEGQSIAAESLDMLIPTISQPGSEIWITFNPHSKNDPVYDRFIVNQQPGAIVRKVNYAQNPWFPEVLRVEMEWDKKTNPDRYEWVWLGFPRGVSDAQIFRGKFIVQEFEATDQDRLFFGIDWGFANDPTSAIRSFIRDKSLYIEHESYGRGVDIDETPVLLDKVPDIRKWRSYADCARPETISYMQKNGFTQLKPCAKWPGSVEDGIEYIKSFEKVIIHPRCKNIIEEFENYQYKQDRVTAEILPIVLDDWNHGIDALRYSLQDYIRGKKIVMI